MLPISCFCYPVVLCVLFYVLSDVLVYVLLWVESCFLGDVKDC